MSGPVQRVGQDVIKRMSGQHPAGPRFIAAAQSIGATGLNRYIATLQAADVTLPPGLVVVAEDPLTVRHRWVEGPVLSDRTVVLDVPRFIDAVLEIARIVRALEPTDARLDTNLANFCLTGDQVVLLDVLPPLVAGARLEPSDLFEVLFDALCFETSVTLDALIGYAGRALLDAGAVVTPSEHDRLSRALPPPPPGGTADFRFPVSWFRTRAVLALGAVAGQVELGVALDYFAWTSVLQFAHLSEAQRVGRVTHVQRVMKELDLP